MDATATHRTVAGISTCDGKAISVLCNTAKSGPYPDEVFDDRIRYFVGARTPSFRVSALFDSAETGDTLRVFQKLGVNRWKDLGSWKAVEARGANEHGFVEFVLVPNHTPGL